MDKTRSVKYPQITEADYVGKLVSELDDRPQLLPSELKARFDALGKDVIIPALNSIAENIEKDFDTMNETIDTTFGYTCKNLLKNTAPSYSANGITFTVNPDGSITANGTATDRINCVINDTISSVLEVGQNYILSGCPSGGEYNKYRLQHYNYDGAEASAFDVGEGVEYTFSNSNSTKSNITLVILGGVTVENLTFYPMLRKASITDPTYEPYREPVSERLKSCILIESFDPETGTLVTKSADYEG